MPHPACSLCSQHHWPGSLINLSKMAISVQRQPFGLVFQLVESASKVSLPQNIPKHRLQSTLSALLSTKIVLRVYWPIPRLSKLKTSLRSLLSRIRHPALRPKPQERQQPQEKLCIRKHQHFKRTSTRRSLTSSLTSETQFWLCSNASCTFTEPPPTPTCWKHLQDLEIRQKCKYLIKAPLLTSWLTSPLRYHKIGGWELIIALHFSSRLAQP